MLDVALCYRAARLSGLPLHAGFMTDGAGVPTGTPLTDPPLVEAISEDPVLRDTKLIAEAWDCDGLNQARPSSSASKPSIPHRSHEALHRSALPTC